MLYLSFRRYDHQQRLTAREAMDHPFFQSVRQPRQEDNVPADSVSVTSGSAVSSSAV